MGKGKNAVERLYGAVRENKNPPGGAESRGGVKNQSMVISFF